jgi:hypothetical protein
MRAVALSALALALVFAVAASAETPKVVKGINFPTAGVYEIHSKPTFLITVGDSKEVVECDATLVVRAADPYINDRGAHRVDLKVVDWKADGKSALLGGDLKFRMQKGAKTTEESFVESYQLAGTRDFPAQAQFAVPYELHTPFGTVKGLYGVTRGTIKAFPPRGDIFLMEKGDIANLMAELMPEPLSELSAAGKVAPVQIKVQPLACACPSSGLE